MPQLKLILIFNVLLFNIGCASKLVEVKDPSNPGKYYLFELPKDKKWYKIKVTGPFGEEMPTGHFAFISGDNKEKHVFTQAHHPHTKAKTEKDLFNRTDLILEEWKQYYSTPDGIFNYSSESFIDEENRLCVKYNIEFTATCNQVLERNEMNYLALVPSPIYFYEYVLFPCMCKTGQVGGEVSMIAYIHKSTIVNRDPNLETEAIQIMESIDRACE